MLFISSDVKACTQRTQPVPPNCNEMTLLEGISDEQMHPFHSYHSPTKQASDNKKLEISLHLT